jgi:hypothetical protein
MVPEFIFYNQSDIIESLFQQIDEKKDVEQKRVKGIGKNAKASFGASVVNSWLNILGINANASIEGNLSNSHTEEIVFKNSDNYKLKRIRKELMESKKITNLSSVLENGDPLTRFVDFSDQFAVSREFDMIKLTARSSDVLVTCLCSPQYFQVISRSVITQMLNKNRMYRISGFGAVIYNDKNCVEIKPIILFLGDLKA